MKAHLVACDITANTFEKTAKNTKCLNLWDKKVSQAFIFRL